MVMCKLNFVYSYADLSGVRCSTDLYYSTTELYKIILPNNYIFIWIYDGKVLMTVYIGKVSFSVVSNLVMNLPECFWGI